MGPFNAKLVLKEQISESFFRAYNIGFEKNEFRLKPLTELLCRVIPEFAFGHHEGTSISITEIWDKIRDAAESVYSTNKYKKRGEFGELILHLLLRDFMSSVPLISKIYFKDSNNVTIHGFDAVHVVNNGGKKKLWLGESKLYQSGDKGIHDLCEDLKKHLKADYLRKEFSLISKKIDKNFPNRKFWLDLMDRHQTLENIYEGIAIPLVCTYDSEIYKNHSDNTKEFLKDFEKECRKLKEIFSKKKKIKTNVDVYLLLVPIKSKSQLLKAMHEKIKLVSSI